jgi:hypothetical protein
MRRHRYAPSIGMAVSLMRSGLADEDKSIAFEGADQLSGGQGPKPAVVHGKAYTVTAMRGFSCETSSISTESPGPSGRGFPSSMYS